MGKIVGVLRSLMISFLITLILLCLAAVMVHFIQMPDIVQNILVVLIYCLSCLAGGFLVTCKFRQKRLFCGLGFGLLYFMLMFIISLGVDGNNLNVTGMVICAVSSGISGVAGAMLVK